MEEVLLLKEEMEGIDAIRDNCDLSEEELWVWDETRRRLKELQDLLDKDIQQKARCKWAADGDDNTKFFHGLINKRKASNSIPGLTINGYWETRPSKVKKEVFRFFKEKYVEDMPSRPKLRGYNLKRLSEDEAASLVAPFSDTEVKQALFGCGSDKAPGPDGNISRGVGSSFITLIPKSSTPSGLGDYRPITLIGVTSKCDYSLGEANGEEMFIFKIYFQKAYDNVHWGFLIEMLRQLGFPELWCLWVEGILNSACFGVYGWRVF
ncbi:uncharacterized protein LOC110866627 [Helianthus annuus]|uniref:uncharacterized protein LOC110866627 n=1 Tax=Helianthus annuus TaxID=4232 RepID=UPI000B8F967B|nr:uncharacterized protein LOC110866627 [Helianthus annuus]